MRLYVPRTEIMSNQVLQHPHGFTEDKIDGILIGKKKKKKQVVIERSPSREEGKWSGNPLFKR